MEKALLVAALRHDVPDLVISASNHIAAALTVETTWPMLIMAQRYKAWYLKSKIIKYAVQHAKEMADLAPWQEGECEFPRLISDLLFPIANLSSPLWDFSPKKCCPNVHG